MKFKYLSENWETESQSELYSRFAEQLVDFVKEHLSKEEITEEDKKAVIDMMISYGKRMYYRGKEEGKKIGYKEPRSYAEREANDNYVFDIKSDHEE